MCSASKLHSITTTLWPKIMFFRDVAVSWESSNKRANELAFDGIFAVHGTTRHYERYIVCVIAHDAFNVCPLPGGKVFREKCLDLADR